MKSVNNNLTTIFNDLILVNNERANGYRQVVAASNYRNQDLCGLFERMADKSEQFSSDLLQEISRLALRASNENLPGGKIYHAWVVVRTQTPGQSRLDMINTFLGREEAVQKAYWEALELDDLKAIPYSVRLLLSQKNTLDIARAVLEKHKLSEAAAVA